MLPMIALTIHASEQNGSSTQAGMVDVVVARPGGAAAAIGAAAADESTRS
jgi:hypothetical protein